MDIVLRWVFDEFIELSSLHPTPLFYWIAEKALVAMEFRHTVKTHPEYTWDIASRYITSGYEALPERILRCS